jgi:DNA repair protein RadC
MSSRKRSSLGRVEEGQLAFLANQPTNPTTSVKDLPLSEQPLQRLVHLGATALSTTELLVVACGFTDTSTAQQLLSKAEGLAGLVRLSFLEIQGLNGITERKAGQLKAIFELGRRSIVAPPSERPIVRSAADAANLLMSDMGTLEQEEVRAIILNNKNHVLRVQTIYIGSLNMVSIRVGELFREAIRLNAAAIIMVHNHPSGDPSPSSEDVMVTHQMVEAGKLVNIDVLDHLVICQSRWVSLKERGLGF